MDNKYKVFLGTLFTSAMAFFAPITAQAIKLQDDFYGDMYTTSTADEEVGGIFALFFFAIWCLLIVLGFFTMIIWILAIIDIVKRDNWKSENDKIMWLLLVIFINIVSLYYYFFYRKSLDKAGKQPIIEEPETPKVE